MRETPPWLFCCVPLRILGTVSLRAPRMAMPRRSKPQSIQKRVITRAGAAPAPEFLALLQAAHLTPRLIREIRRRYGPAAHTMAQAHAYRLVRDITGPS